MRRETAERLRAARAAHRAVVLATRLDGGEQRLIEPLEGDALEADARAALADDQCRVVERSEGRYLVQPFNPPLRLLVVGAVHVTQPLARMAAELSYAVTVIDPRAAFAREERFAGVARSEAWPDEALRQLGLDHRTAVVVLSHDPKLDDPALEVALVSPAFYVGALGSKRTHEKRRARLAEAGLSEAALARIHAPIGLDIGAKTPAEIAASILAEITAVLRGKAA